MTIRAAALGGRAARPAGRVPAARGRRGRRERVLRPLQGRGADRRRMSPSPWSPGRRGRRSSRSCTTWGSFGAAGSWAGSCCGAPGRPTQIRAGSYTLTTNMTFDEALVVLSTPPRAGAHGAPHDPRGIPAHADRRTGPEALGHPAGSLPDRGARTRTGRSRRTCRRARARRGSCSPRPTGSRRTPRRSESIQRLLDQFDDGGGGASTGRTRRTWASRDYEIVMIASMIEREARVPVRPGEDRRRDLQPAGRGHDARDRRDARYDRPRSVRTALTVSDLEIDSPYNTRINTGLPPTPIASPGIASLRAALLPPTCRTSTTCCAASDGAHRFSVGYDQFLADKDRCLG